MDHATSKTWTVLEVSSFQLETIVTFHPRIAVILNITPDHLDRHKTFANYVNAKARIFENQGPEDFTVLNADDQTTIDLAERTLAQPYDEQLGVTPQADTFTQHEVWDFAHTTPDQYPLFLHFPYFNLYRKQVVKQADLVLAMHLRGDAFTWQLPAYRLGRGFTRRRLSRRSSRIQIHRAVRPAGSSQQEE